MTKEYYASLSGITLQLATQIAMETDNGKQIESITKRIIFSFNH